MGCKIDSNGKKTNQNGRFHVGEVRTMKNLKYFTNEWGEKTSFNRKLLKEYFNVEHPPINIRSGIENIPVYMIYPPPPLHTGILGPGNNAIKFLDEPVDLTNFKAKYDIMGAGPGESLVVLI